MKHPIPLRLIARAIRHSGAALLVLLLLTCAASDDAAAAGTGLADQPVFAGADVPGNLALALSVEYPTAISVANIGAYADTSTSYLGYFDPQKCYTYVYAPTAATGSYFQPASFATGTNNHQCSGQWSGNFMNWVAMQTIDPFRWALTGGYRSVDQQSLTILEKAWGTAQGSPSANFNYRGTDPTGANNLPVAVSTVTPFNTWTKFNSAIWGNGNMMVFSGTGKCSPTPCTDYTTLASNLTSSNDLTNDLSTVNTTNGAKGVYRVSIRVRVCDPTTTTMGVLGLESNCVQYGTLNYKPEGLMQQYSNKIEFSAFSYLNQDGQTRQGGVLREPMGFIGPTYPQPLSTTLITNSRPEWDATTGIMNTNPDSALASSSGVPYSGVMNYLNSFGETAPHSYMSHDNVSELYYAAVRYFENLGNVPEWTNSVTTAQLDGFPAVINWADPISYSCQKNFILGIGDDHTWYDYNVGGATNASGPRPRPSAVTSDAFNHAATWTTNLQALDGLTQTPWWITSESATYYIAGLAYGVHVNDIRPDLTGAQTISTYWMDVEEGGGPENLNPYYLATKYGGFTPAKAIPAAPTTAPYDMTQALNQGQWDPSGNTIVMNGNHTQLKPDNYYLAGSANLMVSGLKAAFTNIANAVKAYTTSFSFSATTVATSGTESFASQYDSIGWNSVITASHITFDSSGSASATTLWTTSSTLQAQLAGTGWNTGRRVATWSGSAGVPFEMANLSSTQKAALLPSYSSGPNPTTAETNYLAWLRGDQTNEVSSTASGSTKSLRNRTLLLGDIVDASLTPVSAPSQLFTDSNNPGYSTFKATYANRQSMVYAAANDGMVHGFVGSTGTEQFAYVPSAVFQGPNGTPQVDGLAQLGNPSYSHHFYVDATPLAFDIDLGNTGGTTGSPTWRTLLIGGLGKGGRSYYAIDVTDPVSNMTNETLVASAVQWEFTMPTMGYSFGSPLVVKTAKWGWVVAFTSGYNSSDSYGHLYLVNPATGALLQDIATPSASNGLAQATAFITNYSDYTADSIYVGDLNGQLWRFDLRGTPASYPAPTLLAQLTDGSGVAQPVTTAPLIEISPTTRFRYVMVGTGQLLSSLDLVSSVATQVQSFYAILDGTAGGFNAVSTPITRSLLTPVPDVTAGVTLSPSSKGWYTDLGTTSGIGWRVVVNPIAFNGIVSFTTLLTTGDACSPSGQSRVYAINYANATSVLQPTTAGSTTPAPYYSVPSAANSLKFFDNGNANNSPELAIGCATCSGPLTPPGNYSGTIGTRLLNWREIPTAE